jgi:hypothetical protein
MGAWGGDKEALAIAKQKQPSQLQRERMNFARPCGVEGGAMRWLAADLCLRPGCGNASFFFSP